MKILNVILKLLACLTFVLAAMWFISIGIVAFSHFVLGNRIDGFFDDLVVKHSSTGAFRFTHSRAVLIIRFFAVSAVLGAAAFLSVRYLKRSSH